LRETEANTTPSQRVPDLREQQFFVIAKAISRAGFDWLVISAAGRNCTGRLSRLQENQFLLQPEQIGRLANIIGVPTIGMTLAVPFETFEPKSCRRFQYTAQGRRRRALRQK